MLNFLLEKNIDVFVQKLDIFIISKYLVSRKNSDIVDRKWPPGHFSTIWPPWARQGQKGICRVIISLGGSLPGFFLGDRLPPSFGVRILVGERGCEHPRDRVWFSENDATHWLGHASFCYRSYLQGYTGSSSRKFNFMVRLDPPCVFSGILFRWIQDWIGY